MRPYSMDLRERVVGACDAREGSREQIAKRFGVSTASIRRLLQRRRATGSNAPPPPNAGRKRQEEGRRWWDSIVKIDPARLVFIDEAGAQTNMTRLRGRAPRGERVIEYAPAGHWHTTTMLAALR